METLKIIIPDRMTGQRLDVALSEMLPITLVPRLLLGLNLVNLSLTTNLSNQKIK